MYIKEQDKPFPMKKQSDFSEIFGSVAIDFDGTICEFAWPDEGPPTKGVKKALKEIKAMGLGIIIHSSRASSYWGKVRFKYLQRVEEYMKKHKLPYDGIHTGRGKPIAIAYIDDRAVEYRGNWDDVVKKVKELRPV